MRRPGRRRARRWVGVAIVAAVVVVNVVAASTEAQVDLSANRRFSLQPETRTLVEAVADDLDVTAFVNRGGGTARDARFLLARFRELNRHISYEIIDPDERPSATRRFGITDYATVVLRYQGRRVDAPSVTERDLGTAILRLLRAREPVVCWLAGHGEASLDDDGPDGMSKVATLLEQNAYDVRPLDLATGGGGVPDDCEVVVAAGPRVGLTPSETTALVSFVEDAGSMLVLASPLSDANVNPLLQPWGITFLGGVVADPDRSESLDPLNVVAEDFPTVNPVMDGIPRLQLPVGGGLLVEPRQREGLTVSRLAQSSGGSWLEATPDDAIEPGPGDLPGPVVMAAAADDSRIQAGADRRVPGGRREGVVRTRLVVTGSAEWPTNQLLDRLGNRRLLVNALGWLTEEEELLTVGTRLPDVRSLPWTTERQRSTLLVTVGLVPGLVVLAGLLQWWWRRRRRA